MKHGLAWILVAAALTAGCGGDGGADRDPSTQWFSSPTKVVEGIMHAYETRDDSLYAALLSDDFRYYFEPAGADSADILGWGKEEEVVATGTLFQTPDVESLRYTLEVGEPRPAEREGWMVVPVAGGQMVVMVRNKEPMTVTLNRQEIVVRPEGSSDRWVVAEWYDYPEPEGAGNGEPDPQG